MVGWEQLRSTETEHRPTARPLEFRHLQKCKYTLIQMGHIHEQRWWIKDVSSELSSVWNRICRWCPSYSWGHRGSYAESQSHQVCQLDLFTELQSDLKHSQVGPQSWSFVTIFVVTDPQGRLRMEECGVLLQIFQEETLPTPRMLWIGTLTQHIFRNHVGRCKGDGLIWFSRAA